MRHLAMLVPLAAGLIVVACGGEEAEPTPAVLTPTVEATPTVVPAVETLAFIRDGDVWLVEADGNNERQLGLSNVESFSWISAMELDVITNEEPPRHLLVDTNGNVRELFFPSRGSWSRNATRYVVVVDERVVVFDRDGVEVARFAVTPPSEFRRELRPCGTTLPNGEPDRLGFGWPVFSPDGQNIFVAVNCMSRVGANTFFKPVLEVSLDGTVTAVTSLTVNTTARPQFSPDGRHLAQRDAFHLSACAFGSTLIVADAHGMDGELLEPTELSRLSTQLRTPTQPLPPVPSGGVVGFDWSPQSDAVVASVDVWLCPDAASAPEPYLAGLYVLGLDGSEEKLIDGPTRSPVWSPSRRYIVYVAGGTLGRAGDQSLPLHVLDLSTGDLTDLGPGTAPAWQPFATPPPSP